MKKILLALLAVAVSAPSAAAAPGTCISVKDPAGDVNVVNAPTRPAGVDLLAGRATSGPNGLTLHVTLAGDPTPALYENFVYALDFEEPGTLFQLMTRIDGGKKPVFTLRVGETTVSSNGVSTTSWTSYAASGLVDTAKRTVTVTASKRHFPSMREGRRFTVTSMRSGHGYVSGYGFGVDDFDVTPTPFVLGDGRCKR